MKKLYKINEHNSTVCGYPGRTFDWSKFDWKGEGFRTDGCSHPGCHHKHAIHAPAPHVDDYLIGEGNQYLHVAYDWEHMGVIYRVRPNESMRAGQVYRGMKVLHTKAVKQDDGWYWELVGAKIG